MKSYRMHQDALRTGIDKAKQDLVNIEKTRFSTKYIIPGSKDNESYSYSGRSAFLQETRDNISK